MLPKAALCISMLPKPALCKLPSRPKIIGIKNDHRIGWICESLPACIGLHVVDHCIGWMEESLHAISVPIQHEIYCWLHFVSVLKKWSITIFSLFLIKLIYQQKKGFLSSNPATQILFILIYDQYYFEYSHSVCYTAFVRRGICAFQLTTLSLTSYLKNGSQFRMADCVGCGWNQAPTSNAGSEKAPTWCAPFKTPTAPKMSFQRRRSKDDDAWTEVWTDGWTDKPEQAWSDDLPSPPPPKARSDKPEPTFQRRCSKDVGAWTEVWTDGRTDKPEQAWSAPFDHGFGIRFCSNLQFNEKDIPSLWHHHQKWDWIEFPSAPTAPFERTNQEAWTEAGNNQSPPLRAHEPGPYCAHVIPFVFVLGTCHWVFYKDPPVFVAQPEPTAEPTTVVAWTDGRTNKPELTSSPEPSPEPIGERGSARSREGSNVNQQACSVAACCTLSLRSLAAVWKRLMQFLMFSGPVIQACQQVMHGAHASHACRIVVVIVAKWRKDNLKN